MNESALQTITDADPVADLEDRVELDAAVERLDGVVELVAPPGERRNALQGRWLGHPLHPPLTDLVSGFWTSALVLTSTWCPAAACGPPPTSSSPSAWPRPLPTVAAGLADWSGLDRPRQRMVAVHAGANTVAAGCYALSLLHRLRDRRARGVGLTLAWRHGHDRGWLPRGHRAFPPDEAPNPPRPRMTHPPTGGPGRHGMAAGAAGWLGRGRVVESAARGDTGCRLVPTVSWRAAC